MSGAPIKKSRRKRRRKRKKKEDQVAVRRTAGVLAPPTHTHTTHRLRAFHPLRLVCGIALQGRGLSWDGLRPAWLSGFQSHSPLYLYLCVEPNAPEAIVAIQRREHRYHGRVVSRKDLHCNRAVERPEQFAEKTGHLDGPILICFKGNIQFFLVFSPRNIDIGLQAPASPDQHIPFSFLGGGRFGLGCARARHSEVKFTVVVSFARTDDGRDHQQGATFAQADVGPIL